MKKLESSLKNMVIVLTGVTVVAGALLGYVNELTKEPIAQANAKALSDAIAIVVPGFDNNPAEAPETIELEGVTYKIYKATKGGIYWCSRRVFCKWFWWCVECIGRFR